MGRATRIPHDPPRYQQFVEAMNTSIMPRGLVTVGSFSIPNDDESVWATLDAETTEMRNH